VSWRIADGVAVITIEAFSEHSARDVRNAIRAIRREARHPVGYVLDLRDNPGGPLDQVIEAIDTFVDGGSVLTVSPVSHCSQDEPQRYNARRGDETDGARILVLVNSNTASGAEIAAASLREIRHAILVGQPTLGNAKVHTVIPMNGGRDGFLRLRTGTLSTPSGQSYDGTGIMPDVPIETRDAQTDPAMERALAMLGTPEGQ
jgi:carboxyl-terminal processing protease